MVSSLKKLTQTRRNALSSSMTGPAQGTSSSSTIERVLNDILLTDDHGLLSQWLAKFCTEAQKQDGERYPPTTIQNYLMALQQHIRTQKKNNVNFMGDAEFLPLRNLLEALYHRLHVKRIGCSE